jgi:hypothetical protein
MEFHVLINPFRAVSNMDWFLITLTNLSRNGLFFMVKTVLNYEKIRVPEIFTKPIESIKNQVPHTPQL